MQIKKVRFWHWTTKTCNCSANVLYINWSRTRLLGSPNYLRRRADWLKEVNVGMAMGRATFSLPTRSKVGQKSGDRAQSTWSRTWWSTELTLSATRWSTMRSRGLRTWATTMVALTMVTTWDACCNRRWSRISTIDSNRREAGSKTMVTWIVMVWMKKRMRVTTGLVAQFSWMRATARSQRLGAKRLDTDEYLLI